MEDDKDQIILDLKHKVLRLENQVNELRSLETKFSGFCASCGKGTLLKKVIELSGRSSDSKYYFEYLHEVIPGVYTSSIDRKLIQNKCFIVDFIVACDIIKSKNEAKRLVKQGGVYINNVRMFDETCFVNKMNILSNQTILVRIGKSNYFSIAVVDWDENNFDMDKRDLQPCCGQVRDVLNE